MRQRPPDWMPGGPASAGGADPCEMAPGETLDCLSGHWRIFQLRRGHRYSTDDLLVAWYAKQILLERGARPASHLDLGCGVGSVGLLVLWNFPGIRLVGVEAQEVSAALARKSIHYNGVTHRAEIRCGDFRTAGVLARAERFDLVTGSPPYLAAEEGHRSHAPQRGPCRFEDRGGVQEYLRIAAGHLSSDGVFVWAHAARRLDSNVAAALASGLGSGQWRKVVFREGKESVIALFWGARAAGSGWRAGAPLVVRRADGSWSDEYRGIRAEMGFPT